jgi:hypothetical protein
LQIQGDGHSTLSLFWLHFGGFGIQRLIWYFSLSKLSSLPSLMAPSKSYDAYMFKVIGLIVIGILLMTFGTYFLSIANLPVLQLPDVNWTLVGFVTIIGSIVTFGSAFAVSRLA